MRKYENPSNKFFGETFYYLENCLTSKNEAIQYLNLWKKNLLHKLNRDSFNCEIVFEQWIERDAKYCGSLASNAALSLKICLKANWEYELK